MTTCSTCSASLTEDECKGDECPICGGALETFEDRNIARSIAIPKNWAANLDGLTGMFDSATVAALEAQLGPQNEPAEEVVEKVAEPQQHFIDADATVDAFAESKDTLPLDVESDQVVEKPESPDDANERQSNATSETPVVVEPDIPKPPAAPRPGSVLGGILKNPEVQGQVNQTMARVGDNVTPQTSIKLEDSPRILGGMVLSLIHI